MHSLMLKGRVSSNNLIKFGLSQFTGGVVYGVHDLSPESIGRAAWVKASPAIEPVLRRNGLLHRDRAGVQRTYEDADYRGYNQAAGHVIQFVVPQFVGLARFTLDVDSAHLTNSIVTPCELNSLVGFDVPASGHGTGSSAAWLGAAAHDGEFIVPQFGLGQFTVSVGSHHTGSYSAWKSMPATIALVYGHTGARHLVALWSGSLAASQSDILWWPSQAENGVSFPLAASPPDWLALEEPLSLT
jgi:hypothetical protein